MVFWMLNWVSMLAVYVLLDHNVNIGLMHIHSGLALESLITILTARYVPFFMVLLIIGMNFLLSLRPFCLFFVSANISVCIYPIDMLPRIFRYGYAAPFFNVSQSVRTIVFGTKNRCKVFFFFFLKKKQSS